MGSRIDAFVAALNQHLDARALLELIGFHTDRIRAIGSGPRAVLKAPCPVHQDSRLATLTVHVERRTYKCLVSSCAAHHGGTLVELYALWSGKSLYRAALHLASAVPVRLDGDLQPLAVGAAEEAGASALEARDYDETRRAIDDLEGFGETTRAHVLAARLNECSDAGKSAVDAYVEAARNFIDKGNLAEAERLLKGDALRLEPENELALEVLVRCQAQSERLSDAAASAARLCSLRETGGRPLDVIGLLNELGEDLCAFPELAAFRARALDVSENTEGALRWADRALAGSLSTADRASMLGIVARLRPDDFAARQQYCQVLFDAGRTADGARECVDAGQQMIEAGELARAEELLRDAHRRLPDDTAVLEALVELAVMNGAEGEQKVFLGRLVEVYRAQGETRRACERLRMLWSRDAANPRHGAAMVELLVEAGDPGAASEAALEAAEKLAANGAVPAAADVLAKAREHAADPVAYLAAAVGVLVATGARDEAVSLLDAHAGDLGVDGGRRLVLEQVIESHPNDQKVNQLYISCLRETGDAQGAARAMARAITVAAKDGRIRQCVDMARDAVASVRLTEELAEAVARAGELADSPADLVEALLARADERTRAGRSGEAVLLLQTATRLDPGEPGPQARLAELCEAVGDEVAAAGSWAAAAKSFLRRGEVDQGARAVERLRALDPHSPEGLSLWLRLAGAHPEKAGDAEAARRALGAALERGEERDVLQAARRTSAVWRDDDGLQLIAARVEAAFGDRDGALARLSDLARAYERRGETDMQESALRAVIQVDPGRTAEARKLVSCLWALNRRDEALGEARALLGRHYDEDDVEAACLFLRSFIEETGIGAESCRAFWRIQDERDDRAGALGGIEWFLGQAGRDEALRAAEFGLELDPENERFLEFQVEHYERVGLLPKAAEAALKLGRVLAETGRARQTIALCQKLMEIAPFAIEGRALLAECLEKEGQDAKAADEWREAGRAYRQAGQLLEALDAFESASRLAPGDPRILELQAEVCAEAGRSEEASACWLLAAELILRDGDRDPARRLLDRALAAAPDRIETLKARATLLVQAGDVDEGVEAILGLLRDRARSEGRSLAAWAAAELERAAPRDAGVARPAAELLREAGHPQLATALLLHTAERLLNNAEPGGAGALLEESFRHAPADLPSLRLMVRVHLANDEVREARDVLAQVAGHEARRGNTGAVEAAWREALEIDPADAGARIALAEVLAAAGAARAAEAADLLEAFEQTTTPDGQLGERLRQCYGRLVLSRPDDLDLRERLARICLEQDRHDDALEHFEVLGQARRAAGDTAEAVDYFTKALELAPENGAVLDGLFGIHMELGDAAEATAYAIRLAAVLEKQGALEDALALSRELASRFPGNDDARRQVCNYLLKLGLRGEAVAGYFDLAAALLSDGRSERAVDTLERLVAIPDLEPGEEERLAELYLEAGEPEKAMASFRASVESHQAAGAPGEALRVLERLRDMQSGDLELREWRAVLLADAGQGEEAARILAGLTHEVTDNARLVEVFEKLFEIAPDSPEDRSRYAKALAGLGEARRAAAQQLKDAREMENQGRTADARVAAEAALETDPESEEAHDMLVRLRSLQGDVEGASECLLWLIHKRRSEGKEGDVRRLFRQAIELTPHDRHLRYEWAEQLAEEGNTHEAAAQLTRTAKSYADDGRLREAMELVQRALELEPVNTGARILQAELYDEAARPEDALQAYLDVLREQLDQGLVDEAHQLVQSMYLRHGGKHGVRRQVADLFNEAGIPELAAQEFTAIASLCLDQHKYEEAKVWCRRALDLRARDIEARERLAAAHLGLGEEDEGAAMLAEAADLYESAGAVEKAAGALRSYLEVRPGETESMERLADLTEQAGNREESAALLRDLARRYRQAGDNDQALLATRRLIKLAPGDTQARFAAIDMQRAGGASETLARDYLDLAAVYADRGSAEEARAMLNSLRELSPNDPEILRGAVELLTKLGDTREAIEESLRLAQVYSAIDEPKKAAEALEGLEKDAAERPEYHLAQGRLLLEGNARGKALAAFQKAAELYANAGDARQRAVVLAEIVKIDPQNLDKRRELIDLYKRLHMAREAAQEQLGLARIYHERGLLDLAEAEYRAVTISVPENYEAWRELFRTHLDYGEESELASDYMRYANLMAEAGRVADALQYYSTVIRLDPENIEARERYVRTYVLQGPEVDLVEDYLALADLLVSADRVDEAIGLFSKVMSLDPRNREAMERLSETQARVSAGLDPRGDKSREPRVPSKHLKAGRPRPADPGEDQPQSPRIRDTQAARDETAESAPGHARRFLEEEAGHLEDESEREALEQVVDNYRDILSMNPHNANVRVKLADLLEQLGRREEAISELAEACETMFKKGDHNGCIAVCERILEADPTNQKARLRLRQAFNKRDAFKALESAILFSDNAGTDGESKVRRPSTPPA